MGRASRLSSPDCGGNAVAEYLGRLGVADRLSGGDPNGRPCGSGGGEDIIDGGYRARPAQLVLRYGRGAPARCAKDSSGWISTIRGRCWRTQRSTSRILMRRPNACAEMPAPVAFRLSRTAVG